MSRGPPGLREEPLAGRMQERIRHLHEALPEKVASRDGRGHNVMRPIIVFLTGALAAWLWFDSGAALAENLASEATDQCTNDVQPVRRRDRPQSTI